MSSDDFLQDEFGGRISLTDVTGSRNASKADITLHYVPLSPELVQDFTMHELGHALGLGHAEPILTTSDLMGHGWYFNFFPFVLSACDVKAFQLFQ